MRKILIRLINAGCDVPTAAAVVSVLRSNLKTTSEGLEEALAYLYAYETIVKKALANKYGPPPNRDKISNDFKIAKVDYLEFGG